VSGTTLTSESGIQFFTAEIGSGIDVQTFDASSAIVTFSRTLNDRLYARQLNLSGTTLSALDSFQVVDGDFDVIASVSCLSSTKAVVAYRTNADSSTSIRAKVLTISGSVFSAGTEVTIWDQGNYTHDYIDVAAYDDENFVAVIKAHNDGGTYDNGPVVAVHCSVSGDAITVETSPPLIVDAGDAAVYIANCALTATHGIVAYRNLTDTDGKAACLYLS